MLNAPIFTALCHDAAAHGHEVVSVVEQDYGPTAKQLGTGYDVVTYEALGSHRYVLWSVVKEEYPDRTFRRWHWGEPVFMSPLLKDVYRNMA